MVYTSSNTRAMSIQIANKHQAEPMRSHHANPDQYYQYLRDQQQLQSRRVMTSNVNNGNGIYMSSGYPLNRQSIIQRNYAADRPTESDYMDELSEVCLFHFSIHSTRANNQKPKRLFDCGSLMQILRILCLPSTVKATRYSEIESISCDGLVKTGIIQEAQRL